MIYIAPLKALARERMEADRGMQQFPDGRMCVACLNPIGSMYGIYANIGGILMVNVTIYSITHPFLHFGKPPYGSSLCCQGREIAACHHRNARHSTRTSRAATSAPDGCGHMWTVCAGRDI